MLKIFYTHIGQYKKATMLAPLFMLIETAISLILPSIMSSIVDIGIKQGDMPYIIRCGIIMLALSAVAAVCGVLCARQSSKAAQGFGSNLRQAMYHHMQEFSFADVDKFSSSSLITRTTNDVHTLQMALQMGLRVLAQAPCQLIVALIIVVGYSVRLSTILLAAMPILFIFVSSLMRYVRRLFVVMQQKLDNLNGAVQEDLIAIRVIKSFVREKYEHQQFKVVNDEFTKAGMNAMVRMAMMQPMSTVIINSVLLLIYWFGGQMVGHGELLSGELLAIITYLQQIMMSIMMFSMILMQASRAQACVIRIQEVLNTVPDITDSAESPVSVRTDRGGEVEFKNVSFKYSTGGTGSDVLNSVSFKVSPGETVAVVGDTGSGKSSLVNLIPRFYDVTGGGVFVDGVDVRDYGLTALRDKIGMVLQNNVLFTGTIRDNVRWGKPDAGDDEVITALKNAQAYDFVMATSEGLDTEILQGGTNVSGGQKQRLCIARAMLKKPEILILDDSTSAVDSDTEKRIRASFDSESLGCTVFIIAQRISSVMNADKIIVLSGGMIDSVGTHEELMEHSAMYKEIFQSQQEGALGHV